MVCPGRIPKGKALRAASSLGNDSKGEKPIKITKFQIILE
jgi:hypothetical protein